VVVEAMGGGHVPSDAADAVGELAASMPVVYASRTQVGEVLRARSGFPGSERDLLVRGAIGAGLLNGRKARVLLSLLLSAGPAADVPRRFAAYLDAGNGHGE
jgi:L-asparaginase